jgi:hypothetical protein
MREIFNDGGGAQHLLAVEGVVALRRSQIAPTGEHLRAAAAASAAAVTLYVDKCAQSWQTGTHIWHQAAERKVLGC